MKNIKHIIVSVLLIVCFFNNLLSQSDKGVPVVGHAGLGFPTYYVGWDAATNFDLNIEHRSTIKNINFLLGGTPSGQLDQSANANTSYGYLTFNSIAGGQFNSLFGHSAGSGLTSGSDNSFYGYKSGLSTTTAVENSFMGSISGQNNTSGSYNTFIGMGAGYQNTSGAQNTFIGHYSGPNCTTSTENTFVGESSGRVNATGSQNTFLGEECGYWNMIGRNNAFVGHGSGFNNLADSNVFIGDKAGFINTTGKYNSSLGTRADFMANNLTNATAIGANCKVPASNQVILGDINSFVGIGLSGDAPVTGGPQNSLEINSDPTSYGYTGYGSGLRFRQLTDANATLASNPGPGVLAVDDYGNVVYVPDNSSHSSLGNVCGAAPNLLGNDWEVPLNKYNFIFSGDGSQGANKVGIGKMAISCKPSAKLDVENDATGGIDVGGRFMTYGTGKPATSYYGIWAQSYVSSSPWNNIGGSFAAWNSLINNFGLTSNSDGNSGDYNYGGYFHACNAHKTNYGIYSEVCTPEQGSGTVNWAGWFQGNVMINGTATCTANAWTPSDAMFKTNVDTIANALSIIKQLKPKTYFMDSSNVYGINFESTRQYGVIAQELQQVLPSLVKTVTKQEDIDTTGNVVHPAVTFKEVNYTALIPFLIKGMQEQSKTIDSLKTSLQNQINTLTDMINSCCSNGGHRSMMNNTTAPTNSTSSVVLSNKDVVVLDQNIPNPFAEQTTINYYLPETVSKAQMLFYDAMGKLIKSVDLTSRGQSQLTVFANDLTNGVYSYSLIVDEQLFETKKMVKN